MTNPVDIIFGDGVAGSYIFIAEVLDADGLSVRVAIGGADVQWAREMIEHVHRAIGGDPQELESP